MTTNEETMDDRTLERIEKVWLRGDDEPFTVGTQKRLDGSDKHEAYRSTFEVHDFFGRPGFRFTSGRKELIGPIDAIAALSLGSVGEHGQWT